jgi:hypothetical protein
VTPEIYAVYSTTEWPLSKAIRKLTNSDVSHCSLWLKVFGVPLVLQASIGGVKFETRERWLNHNKVIKVHRFKVDVTRGVQSALGFLNTRYDYVGLFGYLPVMLARWFGRIIKNPLASANAQVCSEFLLHVDAFDEVKEWNDLEWETTSPTDLMLAAKDTFEEVSLDAALRA